MSHTHIGPQDWSCIARMLRAGHSLSEIARTIGKTISAVSRHIAAYGGKDEYDAQEVRRRKRTKRIAAMETTRVVRGSLLRCILKELKQHKSPEQIAGILAHTNKHIAPSTIYRYLDERAPHLKIYLRSQKEKYRRKRDTIIREKDREQRKKRRIDERPVVVNRRGRIGDFEGDTVMGAGQTCTDCFVR